MSERKPVESDMPAWMCNDNLIELWQISHFKRYFMNPQSCGWLYWKPAVLPAPPAKELTQAEKDKAEFNRFMESGDGLDVLREYNWHGLWHAALAYRDGQNASDLKGLFPPTIATVLSFNEVDALNSLRRRCGLDQ